MSNLLQGIDIVIFDLGNVLIDLDYPRIIQGFKRVAKKNHENIRKLVMESKLLTEFETGRMEAPQFRAAVNQILKCNLTEREFESIWNSMLLNLTKERMRKLVQIGKQFDSYILSNTNIIHEFAFEEMVMDTTGRDSIRDFVKRAFFSHEIGLRKPDIEFYEYVTEEIGKKASRMIFLDDRLDNIEAAKKVGMKAVQIFNPDKQLKEIFGLG